MCLLTFTSVVPATAGTLRAQDVPILRLQPANGRLDGDFSRILSTRELADGRLLFTDERENRIFVGDFASGRVSAVGRRGNGPGEFTQVGRLWPLAGDSTAMADRTDARWLVLLGDRIVQTLPPDAEAVRRAGGIGKFLTGLSWDGDGLATSYGLSVAGGAVSMTNDLLLIRFHRTAGVVDTIRSARPQAVAAAPVFAGVERAARPRSTGGAAPTRRIYSVGGPHSHGVDQAVMFPDGWVAVARAVPYQVEWCPPRGSCILGPVLEPGAERMTDQHRRTFLPWMTARTGWPPTTNVDETANWPELVPAFVGADHTALVALSDGRLLVQRTPAIGLNEARFDIVDRQGRRVMELRAPLNHRIVGFGPRSVHVVVADEDGLQRFQRHPWP